MGIWDAVRAAVNEVPKAKPEPGAPKPAAKAAPAKAAVAARPAAPAPAAPQRKGAKAPAPEDDERDEAEDEAMEAAADEARDEGDSDEEESGDEGGAGDGPSDDDEWAGWDPDDAEGFWMKVHAIEAAGNESDEALDAALAEHGLKDKAHFDRVRDSFAGHYGDDPDFMQAAIDARTKATKQQMSNRLKGELKGELAPFEGVSLEQWAWLMAKVASGGALPELLALAKMDTPKWDRVSAEWNARMGRDTTASIATAYGQAFVATGPGPFGEAGKATASAMLDPKKKGVDGKPPISMEKWIEITEAQSAGSKQGLDASAILKSYKMTPADWGTVGGWWSQHFNANAMKLMGEYNRLSKKYQDKFASGFSADDIDF
jgi:hypothetical protein